MSYQIKKIEIGTSSIVLVGTVPISILIHINGPKTNYLIDKIKIFVVTNYIPNYVKVEVISAEIYDVKQLAVIICSIVQNKKSTTKFQVSIM